MARSSTFNVDEFLQTTINPEGQPFDTKISFVEDGEYPAEIMALSKRTVETDDRGDRELVEVTFNITDPDVQEKMNIDEPRARMTIWLDNESDGRLSLGRNKNVRLGQLLTAVGLNTGKPWSWGQLLHATCWVRTREPRNAEAAIMTDVAMVGRDRGSVERASRR